MNEKIGVESVNHRGMKGKCIEYTDTRHIKILMENGEIINGRWDRFLEGTFGGVLKPLDRTGERKQNNQGSWMTIASYINNSNIIVIFDTGYKVKSSYIRFKQGTIQDVLFPSVRGKGYIGIGKYKPSINRKNTKEYEKWSGMIDRCYNITGRNPTYENCEVCNEWLNFQNFAEWYEKNYYEVPGEKMCIDKDIIYKGNKIYSPENCCIIPNSINTIFTKNNINRGECVIGVTKNKKRNTYIATVNKYNENIYLGEYLNMLDAFNIYKREKEKYIQEVANNYKQYLSIKIYEALLNYKVEVGD